MQRLSIRDADFETKFARLVDDRRESEGDVSRTVSQILGEVRALGDAALAEYTERFDKHVLAAEDDWRIAPHVCREAYDALAPKLRDALELAAARIRAYHLEQLPDFDFQRAPVVSRFPARFAPRARRFPGRSHRPAHPRQRGVPLRSARAKRHPPAPASIRHRDSISRFQNAKRPADAPTARVVG